MATSRHHPFPMNAFSTAIAYDLGEKNVRSNGWRRRMPCDTRALVSLNSPALEALRDEPLFQDLARRVGLPE